MEGPESNAHLRLESKPESEALLPLAKPRGWSRRFVAAGTVFALVAIVGVPMLPWANAGVVVHRGCVGGGEVAQATLWTPVLLLNSPYLGTSHGTALLQLPNSSVSRLTDSISATNGSSTGDFSLDNWSLSEMQDVWLLGPGIDSPCSSHFEAVDESRPAGFFSGGFTATVTLLPAGAKTDSGEPSSVVIVSPISGRPVSSVSFDMSFEHNSWVDSACGGAGSSVIPTTEITGIPVDVPFQVGASTLTVHSVLPSQSSISYFIWNGATGVWQVDPTMSGNHQGSLAFSWSPCA